MIVVTALPLGYISILLYINLGSHRVPRKRIGWIIAEVWVIFALIFAMFTLISQQLGAVPHSSIASELTYQLMHFRTLPAHSPGALRRGHAAGTRAIRPFVLVAAARAATFRPIALPEERDAYDLDA